MTRVGNCPMCGNPIYEVREVGNTVEPRIAIRRTCVRACSFWASSKEATSVDTRTPDNDPLTGL